MIRKLALAAAAVAALGTASLTLTATPTAAKGGFHHHHGHHGFHGGRFFRGLAFDAPVVLSSCYRSVRVINRYGEEVLRTVYVCD
jgi:hypothetical protein